MGLKEVRSVLWSIEEGVIRVTEAAMTKESEEELRRRAIKWLLARECDAKGGYDTSAVHAYIDHLIADREAIAEERDRLKVCPGTCASIEAHGRAAWEEAVKRCYGQSQSIDYDDWAKSAQQREGE